jgi:hypothetical protein
MSELGKYDPKRVNKIFSEQWSRIKELEEKADH